jgi:hypothetical protein
MTTSNEHLRVIEIGGVKIEVDLRTAKQVEQFRVGDKCKVLMKQPHSTEKWVVHHAVIVSFDNFKQLPSIVVCYLDDGYTPNLKFVTVNTESENIEIAASHDDVLIDKSNIVGKINREIITKQHEIESLEARRDYFLRRFGALFGDVNDSHK